MGISKMSTHQLFLHKMPSSQNVTNKNCNIQARGNKCGMVKNDNVHEKQNAYKNSDNCLILFLTKHK